MSEQNILDPSELRGKSFDESQVILLSALDELKKIKFKGALRQLKKTHTLRIARRYVARLRTLMTEKKS